MLRFALLASVAASIAAGVACLTSPPPDLPASQACRPTILHESVVPPADRILEDWPQAGFVVPVQLCDPVTPGQFYFDVFVDYNPADGRTTTPAFFGVTIGAGVIKVPVQIDQPDSLRCHRVEFIAAHGFNERSQHTPDSIGGDSVAWLYNAGGGPAGCPSYDAGSLQDGAFPDAPSDVLVVPDSGAE